MQNRMRSQGHGFFFLLPDIPSSSDPSLPTLCFRRSRGLLARSSTSNMSERSVLDGLLLFGSREGVKSEECELDSVTVSDVLVGNVDRFVEVMDGVSDGEFLRGEVNGVWSPWCELDWLKDKGYYSVGSFVANRIELALRIAWLDLKGGKKQKGVKSKEKSAGSGISANVFWRTKGCLDWFLGLDPGIRKKMAAAFFGKGAKSLAKEIRRNCAFLNDDICHLKARSGVYDNGLHQMPKQLLHATDLDFSLSMLAKSSLARASNFRTAMIELLSLQHISSLLIGHVNLAFGTERSMYNTLASVHTVSDYVLLRFRGFITVVARDSMEHELVQDLNVDHPFTGKPEEKFFMGKLCKNKRQITKQSNSKLESFRVDISVKDPLLNARNVGKKGKQRQKATNEIKVTNALSVQDTSGAIKDSLTTNTGHTALDNHRLCVSRKKSKRKGAMCKNSSSKTVSKVDKLLPDMREMLLPHSLNQNDKADIINLGSVSLLNDGIPFTTEIQNNMQLQSISSTSQSEILNLSGKEAGKDNMVDLLPLSTCNSYDVDRDCQRCEQSENHNFRVNIQPLRSVLERCSTSRNDVHADVAGSNLKVSESTGSLVVRNPEFVPCADQSSHKVDEGFDNNNKEYENNSSPQTILTEKESKEAVSDSRKLPDYGVCFPRSSMVPLRGKSYEWPNLNSIQFSHYNSNHIPAATDRYHLDVTHNRPNHFHQTYFSGRHQVRTSCTERGCGQMMSSLTPPLSLDWPPMIRSSRLSQSGCPSYDSVYNMRLQSSLCTGISNGMQFGAASGDNEWKYSADGAGLPDYQNTFDFIDDNESNWLSEEEYDIHTTNGRDYNKFFGGGIMYWNPSDAIGTSFSRAASQSSEDGSWAWYEADLNRAIDDMIDMPGFPPYSANGMASPTAGTFCSPFDGVGPGLQSHGHGYAISATEINKKTLESQCSVAEVLDEKISGSKNTITTSMEGVKGDPLQYPILRPIVIPSSSRKGSRSEFKYSQDLVSPCLPSSRHDLPRIKRSPSPVVLCVPRSPRVPPPSPVGESRKHRGFPVVRSGSSSPRNWGMRSLHQEENNPGGTHFYSDGPEVVWTSWGNNGISTNSVMQPIPGSLLQDRLIAISQLARDQDHPDVAFHLQPPETVNCPSRRSSLSIMHRLLQEEINTFCKQVSTENLLKKPYINWAVKRVAKSLQVLWPRSRTSIFGSNITGLALPSSDVDLVVCLPPVRNLEPIKEAGILEGRNGIKETCLQHAARYLANQEWVQNDSLKTIENTSIPLIMLVAVVPSDIIVSGITSSIENLEQMPTFKFVEPGKIPHCGPSTLSSESLSMGSCSSYSGASNARTISLDISFKSPSHTGLQTTALVRELTEQFPASVPLALVLKQFLADRNLDRAYSGGLSSYCLVLLITRFLQHEHHIGRPLSQNVGSLLMDFLYFYGNVFDPRQMRISIQGSGLYMNRERGHSIDPIHIDDPLCPTNNVGRNCFRIHQCIKAFADAYTILENELPFFDSDSDPCGPSSTKLLPKIIPSIGLHFQDQLQTKDAD